MHQIRVLLVIVVTAWASVATGQTPGDLDYPVNPLQPVTLLVEKSVQEELKLTPEQLTKLPAFRLQVYKQCNFNVPGADQEAAQLLQREMREVVTKELKGFLTAAQHDRLRQLDLQVSAAASWSRLLRNPALAKELGITELQQARIASLRSGVGTLFIDPQQQQDRLTERRRENYAKIESILTEEQKAKWRQLVGPEFEAAFKMESGSLLQTRNR